MVFGGDFEQQWQAQKGKSAVRSTFNFLMTCKKETCRSIHELKPCLSEIFFMSYVFVDMSLKVRPIYGTHGPNG